MRRAQSISLLFAAVSLGAIVALAAQGRADTIGTAGAVNTTSSGTPPAGTPRVIEIGAQVVENEKINTSGTGSVQVLFIDKTTLNIGPNSTLVIDRFVYNPATTSGEVTLSLSRGVLRVVGGLATHTGGATIGTPLASFGVRGGIATISHGPNGSQAILGFGHLTATTLCARTATNCRPTTVEVSRPGYGVTIAGPNEPPSSPSRASSQDIAKSNAQLGSQSGQSGGASQLPTDTQAAAYDIGTPNSPVAPIPTSSFGRGNALQAILQSTQQTVQQGSQSAAAVNTAKTLVVTPVVPVVPPAPPAPPAPPVPAPTTTYSIVTTGPYSTSMGASPVPYLTGAFAGTGAFTVSPILGYQKGGFNPGTTTVPDVTSRQFQAGLSVTGQGASQNVTLFVMTSEITNAPAIGFTQGGGFDAVTMRNGAQWYGLGYGAVSSATPTSAPNSVPTTALGTPLGSYTLYNADTNLSAGVVTNNQSFNYNSGNYTFNPISTGVPTTSVNNHPDYSGAVNPALHGYVGGLMVTETSTAYTKPYIVTNVTGQPGDVSIYLPGNSSEMGAIFNISSGASPPVGALSTASYQFGNYNVPGATNTARGAYVNPTNFAARAATIFDNGANIPLSTRNGAPVGYADQMMVTADSVDANTSAFLTSISSVAVQPCQCESTQWGFWSTYNGERSGGELVYEDQGNLMLWVAGVPATVGSLPATGTATYTGHAIANISTPGWGGTYLSAGTFSAAVNFGARNGAITINGLDGTNYTGTAYWVPSTTSFATRTGLPLTGNIGARTATLAGSFFQGGATNLTPLYGEMGGSISLMGTNYLGSGIFAARKP